MIKRGEDPDREVNRRRAEEEERKRKRKDKVRGLFGRKKEEELGDRESLRGLRDDDELEDKEDVVVR